MNRSLIVTALALTLAVGCNNAAEEQNKATAAQLEANAKIEATRKEAEAKMVGNFIADVLDAPNDEAVIARVRGEVAALCARFPVYR